MAMTNVIEAMVFTTAVTNVGDVYFKLAKYMFRVKLTLHDEGMLCNFVVRIMCSCCMYSYVLVLTQ